MNSMMDIPSTPLLLLSFLQQSPSLPCELQRELENLHCELRSAAHKGLKDDIEYPEDHDFGIECDGELQTDGHSFHRGLHDLPQADLVLPVHNEVLMVREVAAELIRMADEFNEIVVSQAAECLAKKLSNSSEEGWWNCLAQGVDGLLKEMPGVHTERMVMALTFSLVKAVCERTPRLLRGLYNTMTQ
ncbi:BH3 interacting domain death agonist [Hemibagrus wyckioides]|nr:BH3 interacting domain death agonist [Hemibagrus wyckioides]